MNTVTSYYLEDLDVGMSAEMSRTVSDADLRAYADITGDANPIHLDEDYASNTSFGQRVAHGMLCGGYISAVLGTQLPGPGAVYLAQSLKFKAPVHVGDTVVARVQIAHIAGGKRVRATTICSVGDKIVAEGEAQLMVPRRG